MNTLVEVADPARLMRLARGCYQRALLAGRARWSGADLRGEARRWAAHYAASRANLLARLSRVGYAVSERRGEHGRREMVIRDAPVLAPEVPATPPIAAFEVPVRCTDARGFDARVLERDDYLARALPRRSGVVVWEQGPAEARARAVEVLAGVAEVLPCAS